MIRLPANHITSLQKINQASLRFLQANEKEPTIEELSEFDNMDINKIAAAMDMPTKYASLDAPAINDDDSDVDLASITEDKTIDEPDSQLMQESISEDLKRLLEKELTEREIQVLMLYYGLGGEEYTHEEIAAKLGLTRERVRQIRVLAESKLRVSDGVKILRKYL